MNYNLPVLLLLLFNLANAYNVLVVFATPGKSHAILGEAITNLLLDKGHQVTLIMPQPTANLNKDVRQVNTSSDARGPDRFEDLTRLAKRNIAVSTLMKISQTVPFNCVTHENVQALLADLSLKFDVVIAEWFFTPLLAGLASLYECPLIWLCPTDVHYQVLQYIDENSSPAYTSNLISHFVPPLDFSMRVYELWLQMYTEILQFFYYKFKIRHDFEVMYRKAFELRDRPLPLLKEVAYNGSFLLINSQPAYGVPFKLPQNAKYVGGYHIEPDTKPLAQGLRKLLDNAKYGVIYFSLGSIVKSKNMPEQIKRDLVKMFGQLKQTVLWKFEEDLPDLPKSVHIIKWAPQTSILNHNNTRLFITHGGKLSTLEAHYYGVPIVGIPIFGDNFANLQMALSKHIALVVKFDNDLADKLKVAIDEIFNNPLYTKKAKELSSIYHNLPLTPRQELVHWVEHVVRTGGALYLRSPALMVPWYQKIYLDLILIIIAAAVIMKKILKGLFCRKKCIKIKEKLY